MYIFRDVNKLDIPQSSTITPVKVFPMVVLFFRNGNPQTLRHSESLINFRSLITIISNKARHSWKTGNFFLFLGKIEQF